MNHAATPELFTNNPQWVCLQCGYNMIGEMPDICPFCGARHDRFMAWDEAETFFRVKTHPINAVVGQLLSEPKLGLEHAAYRIETDECPVWIDSPSAFNRDLAPVNAILFTHHHFMGASNQYRRLWNTKISLHNSDAAHPLLQSSTLTSDLPMTLSPMGLKLILSVAIHQGLPFISIATPCLSAIMFF